jgi:hypothetical protein
VFDYDDRHGATRPGLRRRPGRLQPYVRARANWIRAHVDALARPRRRSEADRARQPEGRRYSGVFRYEPGINRIYQELADHYGTVILPTRQPLPTAPCQ